MNYEMIGGIVRAIVTSVGGYFVGVGVVDAEQVQIVAGAVTALVGVVWSIWAKRKK